MKKFFITAALLCTFGAAFAYFADMNGNWTGSLSAPDGNQYPLNYTFKIDGDKLTGKASSPEGSVDLNNGKVKGDSLWFSIDVNGTAIPHAAKYYASGDSIGMSMDFQGMKFHSTLKRAPDSK